MIRITVLAVAALIVVIVAAVIWQHMRYVKTRRNLVHDQQQLLYPAQAFHVLSYLKLAPGTELLDAVRRLRTAVENQGRAQMVYAGKAVTSPLESTQLIERFGAAVQWDAVVLVQYPSRKAFESFRATEAARTAMMPFSQSYSQGMRRPAQLNLLVPQILLGIRARQILTRAPSLLPFVPADAEQVAEPMRRTGERLLAELDWGREAILVANLIKNGTPEEMAADKQYGAKMFALMAEVGNGPMHFGKAVTIEMDTSFDNVAMVYYPGVQYFYDMATSRYFTDIFADKKLGDSQATITVPILHRL